MDPTSSQSDDSKSEATIHIQDVDELRQLIADLQDAVPFLEETEIRYSFGIGKPDGS